MGKDQPLSIFTYGLEYDSGFLEDCFASLGGILILPYPCRGFCLTATDYCEEIAEIHMSVSLCS